MKLTSKLIILCSFTVKLISVSSNAVKDIRDEFLDPIATLELAKLSQAVYDTNETYFEPIPSQYEIIGWIDEGSTEVLIAQGTQQTSPISSMVPGGNAFVIFRGTEEIVDWIVNLQSEMVPIGFPEHVLPFNMIFPSSQQGAPDEQVPILVHKGFNQVFRIYEKILEFLDTFNYENVFVTGHSLGGANAQLFATVYAFRNPNVAVHCSTFAQPRVGNIGFKAFVESIYNLNMWRFVNQNDIVPRLPPFLDGYTHAGHLMWKREKTGNADNTSVSAYYRQTGSDLRGKDGVSDFSLALLGPITANEITVLVEDHFITGIIDDWLSHPSMYSLEFE